MDNLIKNVVKEVVTEHTQPLVEKLKEIEESCHCAQRKKKIEQLYARIGNLETLCNQQMRQLNDACKEINSLKEGTTDILKRNSLNTEEVGGAMNDISNDCFDDNFSLTSLFNTDIPDPPSPSSGLKRKPEEEKTDDSIEVKKAKRYYSWEDRMTILLQLESLEWDGDTITISRDDAESLFPVGKSMFQFTRCYGKKGDNGRFNVEYDKQEVRLRHRCLQKESILCLYGNKTVFTQF